MLDMTDTKNSDPKEIFIYKAKKDLCVKSKKDDLQVCLNSSECYLFYCLYSLILA